MIQVNGNKTSRKAVALRYQKERDNAPVVLAKGQGWLADQILELAKSSNIPVYSDAPLVEILEKLNIGQEIPSKLYEAVALVLAYVMEIDEKQKF
ncbi:MAG: hypothetical protein GX767_05200 [Firmicutes bacterium]|nr:hypothetical protein [Bacillota bacterium]